MSETTARVPGHSLEHEGRPVGRRYFEETGPGQGRCTCGDLSPELPSNNARKRWHRQHKWNVLHEDKP